jgi:hypothetical protein
MPTNDDTGEMLPEIPEDILELWFDRSELFAPPRSDYFGD